MRVIAGTVKRQKLNAPRGWSGRATADRVKEALFNILGENIIGARFLDLYAGIGNVGIEALSRGAAESVFVEKDPRANQAILKNLDHTGLGDKANVLTQEVAVALRWLGKNKRSFDLIFLDPPYQNNLEVFTVELIMRYNLLAGGGLVIVESSKRVVLPVKIDGLVLTRQEKYGDTLLSFYG
ncbi:methyltransferase [Peptococcaceae bacterium SCADC1_2_3]|nr:methyltransferase [Peptococcaceae bacterium SCADC1_2_3]KFI35390.1 methyltransferase [Peptococcaceae bacterium SCADC1_2_3]KFI36819.1 methyltransferase [Peptococcaceae bacterium SCADC1_2_3]HBQ28141.1 16S rRNA (guanine(966)-N(2))-methyltransferase RsmD [Desulfotomaculum sp.]